MSTPVFRAAAAVMGLNVDPAGYCPAIARSNRGRDSSLLSCVSFFWLRVTNAEGEKVGYEASARISPVRGSMATPAAPLAPVTRAASAMEASSAFCVGPSMDSSMLRPGVALRDET